MVKIPTPSVPLQQQPVKTKAATHNAASAAAQKSGQAQAPQHASAQGPSFAGQAVSNVARMVQESFDVQSSSVAISRASTILQTQRSGLESVGEKLQGIDRTLKQSRAEDAKSAAGRGDLKAKILTELEDLGQIISGVTFQGRPVLDPETQIDQIESGVHGRPNIDLPAVGLDVDALGIQDLALESDADIEAAQQAINRATGLVRGHIDAIDHSLLDLEIDTVSLDVAAENRLAARADFFDVASLPAAQQSFGFSGHNSEQALLAQGSDSDALNQLLS